MYVCVAVCVCWGGGGGMRAILMKDFAGRRYWDSLFSSLCDINLGATVGR